jgi:hypothetical protein
VLPGAYDQTRDRELDDTLVGFADEVVSISTYSICSIETRINLADADEAGLPLMDKGGVLGIAIRCLARSSCSESGPV